MKASIFLACLNVLLITAANAAPKTTATPASTTPTSSVACSASSGGYLRGCRNVAGFKTYNECKEAGTKRGWRGEEMANYCTALQLP